MGEQKINMKRLLRISFDSAVFSFIPILSWFILGVLVDENLVNVFSLTYPIQFIWALLKCIFATGANISKEKDKDEDAVLSGMTLGIIVGFIVFGFILLNVDKYISFMNMDVSIYRNFTIYSIIQLYIHLVFGFILEKLYFEDNEKLANKYCIGLNLLNLIVLVISSLITKNQIIIIITTLLSIFIFVLLVTIKQYKKFKFSINIKNFIKYDSVDICNNIFFFIIFLFGLSNAASYGVEYMAALNFVALVTDTQWDSFEAISKVAKIDISRENFNYIEHRNNAYKLLGILLLTIFGLIVIMFPLYNISFILMVIYLLFELINFFIYPIYRIKTCFLQLEYSSLKTTSNKFVASTLRTIVTFFKTPFCTGLGQTVSSIYQFISINYLFHKNYKIEKDGSIVKKS